MEFCNRIPILSWESRSRGVEEGLSWEGLRVEGEAEVEGYFGVAGNGGVLRGEFQVLYSRFLFYSKMYFLAF